MKKKKVLFTVAIVLATIIVAGVLLGLASQRLKTVDTSSIELKVATPVNGVEVGASSGTPWDALASYENYPEARTAVDDALEIIKTPNGKMGVLYVNAKTGMIDYNTSMADSLRNQAFMDEFYNDGANATLIKATAPMAYTDTTEDMNMNAALNAYYNIFTQEDGQQDGLYLGNAMLSREQFLAAMYRSENGHEDNLVGDEEVLGVWGYNAGATEGQRMASLYSGFSWLKPSEGELSSEVASWNMTKAEAIYTMMFRYFPDELAAYDTNTATMFTDIKGSKDLGTKYKVRFTDSKTGEIEYSQGYRLHLLSKMLEEVSGGKSIHLDTEIYAALGLAQQLGITTNTASDWSSAITKNDAMSLFINTQVALNVRDGYLQNTKVGIINPDLMTEAEYEVYVNQEVEAPGIGGDSTIGNVADIQIYSPEYDKDGTRTEDGHLAPSAEVMAQRREETRGVTGINHSDVEVVFNPDEYRDDIVLDVWYAMMNEKTGDKIPGCVYTDGSPIYVPAVDREVSPPADSGCFIDLEGNLRQIIPVGKSLPDHGNFSNVYE